MIVRIQGEGQYELNDNSRAKLEDLDSQLFSAVDTENAEAFHESLTSVLNLVTETGARVADDRVVPSDLILPASDTSLDEARALFTDEGLLHPVEA